MLEKPAIPDEKIADCLHRAYQLNLPSTGSGEAAITFLPLGADLNTAVYHIQSPNHPPHLLKLRTGPIDPASVILPKLLHDQGLHQVIPPIPTQDGRFYTTLPPYTAILTPYIDGKNGYETGLTDDQWRDFGKLMKRFHTADLPATLTNPIRRENYAPTWRRMLTDYLHYLDSAPFDDPLSADLAGFLAQKREIIVELIGRTEKEAAVLQSHPPDPILCHADIHAGNLHITPDGRFYLIDWDTLIIAPKERDLMSIGGGLMGRWRTPEEETRLFYEGYGAVELNSAALTYYRCERIIEDLAIECRQIFNQEGIIEDRERAFGYLKSNFWEGGTIALAKLSQ